MILSNGCNSFYKSPDFDPTIPVFVLLKGQPAIDSGGVLRQVFSDVFYAMANNEGIRNVFNGDKTGTAQWVGLGGL